MNKSTSIGFIGLGTMGLPIALNLVRAGTKLIVWNRSAERCGPLVELGAIAPPSPADVFERSETVILMLADEAATDAVLGRGLPDFTQRVAGRRIVTMGTMSPGYSLALADDVQMAGGRYIEAPVSGSRIPAETGQLIGMLAGESEDRIEVRSLLAPVCRQIFDCGSAPNALRMKLAVNVFLITMVTGLAEATYFARRHNLDLGCFEAILGAGPMASDVSRIKIAKAARRDFERQAGISDVLKNSRLIIKSARETSIASPQMDVCLMLYTQAEALGLGDKDMISVITAIENLTEAESRYDD
ncbi:NAD(P)-dependent oxidoreductase [Asaia krungthepensis]|uniref:3-hydroxyisobutyrate dehydrogenase n=1 Tax=Asaia krungthepensis NRIC 0535 TaxID=1307925 RepID=A0ABQ0Q2S4_9PROT|nr:NAD(P)-dependent oxidoreductase [Asaia krungthepensis]GBQ88615.1 3-hydroxyisobutyrate dehydrogenase [Asaia krungthepensis NRIC 0535]